ncbi:hypothetical protein AYI69_g1886 [Smittium culicis]|uniref:Uncharacterized protein n=1 Tax=Smittium culicis TaxID=133412 RepID=A0A1R1YP13_9FUNG|nr:hypothetical protein AYI69_g1886 [Smittium culicis]
MEQANTQAPMSQEQLMMLTEMVQQLFRERNREQEPEDPHVTTRIPIEEERKIAIHSCPKTSSMNYTPHPLNDTASSTVEKTDSTLYGIQLALAQATRPIDYYVHRRIQENPGMDTAEDTEILLGSTMRAHLADIADTVTQARLDNLHKGLDPPPRETNSVDRIGEQATDGSRGVGRPHSQDGQRLKDSESSPFASASRVRHQRNLIAATLLRRRLPQLQPPLKSIIEPLTANQIFAEEVAASGGGHSRGSTRAPSRGRFAMFKSAWFKLTDNRWVQNIVLRGFRIPFMNPKSPTPNPSSEKTGAEPGGQQSSEEGSRIITEEASHRGNPATGSMIFQ